MTAAEFLEGYTVRRRFTLQKWERESATRRRLAEAKKLSPRIATTAVAQLEQQLVHDGTLLESALQDEAQFLLDYITPPTERHE